MRRQIYEGTTSRMDPGAYGVLFGAGQIGDPHIKAFDVGISDSAENIILRII